MPKHIQPYDNQNEPIIDRNDGVLPHLFFNNIRLKQGETHSYQLPDYESVNVVATGTCHIEIGEMRFEDVGKRQHLFQGKPDSVYAPRNQQVTITGVSETVEVFVAGGKTEKDFSPFRVTHSEVDIVQYGSDDTKTHRKIYHVIGQNQREKTDRLLVSELFTVGAGGWSGFPPHKHDEDIQGVETAFEEAYHFRFNPSNGFGAQFAYCQEDDFGPVYHVKDGSNVLLDRGYHPVVAAPGYEMYYFTILVGKTSNALLQNFEPVHEYQVHTIPGIKDMIAKFK